VLGLHVRFTRAQLFARAAVAAPSALALTAARPSFAGLLTSTTPRFRSQPALDPARVHVLSAPDMTAPGYIFISNTNGERQPGPMIIDDDGELIWFKPRPGLTVMNFNAHALGGQSVLAWWEGALLGSHGSGEFVILGTDYRELTRVRAGDGLVTDFHEFSITPRNTALLVAYRDDGVLLDSVVQEIEIASGDVLFEWRASDHIGFDESYVTPTTGSYDFAHLNAAAVDDGSLLVSSRHAWTVYRVDRTSGEIVWRLGGKKSDFAVAEDAAFAWQHHARKHADGTITVFDNGAGVAQTEPYSRGLRLRLDETAGTASLVQELPHPEHLLASAMGSMEPLDDDGAFIGWGSVPRFSEFRPDGTLRFDAGYPGGGFTYRAFRRAWVPQPPDAPAFAVASAGGEASGYASWNGATAVTHWRVRAGTTKTKLVPRNVVASRSFETRLSLDSADRFAAVDALDVRGRVLGRSAAVRI
jgi:outer membrane protein assembly factor BamB